MAEISVLMSVYKTEKGENLDRALQSVWDDQTLKPLEIILMEDGPLSKELYNVVDKWKEKLGDKFIVLANEKNLGLTKSLNKGLLEAKGDYIARMDSDDISMPCRFRVQKDYLDSHPAVSVLGGALQEFDSHSECLGIRRYPAATEAAIKTIHKANPLAHPTVMMRRSIFEDGLAYNENFTKCQDLVLWFDLLHSGYEIANLDDILLKFRTNEGLFDRRSSSYAKAELKAYRYGLNLMYGRFSLKYIYPYIRFCFRLLPKKIIKKFYGGKIRNSVIR